MYKNFIFLMFALVLNGCASPFDNHFGGELSSPENAIVTFQFSATQKTLLIFEINSQRYGYIIEDGDSHTIQLPSGEAKISLISDTTSRNFVPSFQSFVLEPQKINYLGRLSVFFNYEDATVYTDVDDRSDNAIAKFKTDFPFASELYSFVDKRIVIPEKEFGDLSEIQKSRIPSPLPGKAVLVVFKKERDTWFESTEIEIEGHGHASLNGNAITWIHLKPGKYNLKTEKNLFGNFTVNRGLNLKEGDLHIYKLEYPTGYRPVFMRKSILESKDAINNYKSSRFEVFESNEISQSTEVIGG